MMKVRAPCFGLLWLSIVAAILETAAQTLPFRTDGFNRLPADARQDSTRLRKEKLKDRLGVFLPLRDPITTAAYWNHEVSMATLQNLAISYSTDRYSIYTELVSDYLKISRVYSRIAFGCLVASSDSSGTHDSTSAAVQRLVGGGGNFLLQASTPVFSCRGEDWTADALLAPKCALDMPGANADITRFTGSVDVGVEAIVTCSSVSDRFMFTAQFRLGWIVGPGEFYRRLGRDAPFGAGKLLIGVDINNAVRVHATNVLVGPASLRDKTVWQLGIQLLPH